MSEGHTDRLLVVCGPTAGGKTDLAIDLAQRFDGEIINADSRQVYRYLDIGTAKPTARQRAAAPHHLLDIVDPDEPFTLADYLHRARRAVAEITARGHLPIVVGGTGLYVRALVQGFDVPHVPPNPVLRAELDALMVKDGPAALLARLHRIDPDGAVTVDATNPRRVIRAIEVVETTGRPFAVQRAARPLVDSLVLGLMTERTELYRRADHRVDSMMAAGFLDEVRAALARGYAPGLPALSSLGYRELIAHLQGERSLDDAVRDTKYATHHYIRRQLTWFRREPGLLWIDIRWDAAMQAREAVQEWLSRVGHVGERCGA